VPNLRLSARSRPCRRAYREVVLLVGVEGMQTTEVAEILGLRADAVRQRLSRARTQLTDALGDHSPASWRTA